MLDALEVAADSIIDKLARQKLADRNDGRQLLPFAASIVANVPESAGAFGFARQRALTWVTTLLEQTDISDPAQLVQEMRTHLSLEEISLAIVRTAEQAQAPEHIPNDLIPVATEVRRQIWDLLETWAGLPAVGVEPRFLWATSNWEWLGGDVDELQQWMQTQISEAKLWKPSDVVAFFAQIATYENGGQRLTGADPVALDRLVGIDWLLERFTPEHKGDPITRHYETSDISFEERRRWATNALADLVDRRNSADP